MHHAWQFLVGNLGHFLVDFLSNLDKDMSRHILGPILTIFKIC